jgi:hypothetical protein
MPGDGMREHICEYARRHEIRQPAGARQQLTSGARAAARSIGNESSVVDGTGKATAVGRNPYLADKSTSEPAVTGGPVVLADQVHDI